MIDLYDGDEMQRAIDILTHASIRFQKKTNFHIKVGHYNFFPNRGTIYLDGQPKALPQKGIDAFLFILNGIRRKNPRAIPPPRQERMRMAFDCPKDETQ
jgi:hypothetical protein